MSRSETEEVPLLWHIIYRGLLFSGGTVGDSELHELIDFMGRSRVWWKKSLAGPNSWHGSRCISGKGVWVQARYYKVEPKKRHMSSRADCEK